MLTSTRGPVCRALCASSRSEFEAGVGRLAGEFDRSVAEHCGIVVTAYVSAELAAELAADFAAHEPTSVCTSRLWGIEAPTLKITTEPHNPSAAM